MIDNGFLVDDDNEIAYWDAFWSNRQVVTSVRPFPMATRRYRAFPATLMLIGIVCCGLAPSLALVNLRLPAGAIPGVDVASMLDIGRPSDDELTRFRLFSAVALASALALLWIRHWLLGAPLRLIFLGALTYPAFLCARLWWLAHDFRATPGVGLRLWTSGLAVCLLGAMIPAYSRPLRTHS